MKNVGLLLINLGTPDDTSIPSIRRYLREFLSDPRVIDIAPLARWLLLNLIILPFRPKKAAEAYKKIWTLRGSPLSFHLSDLSIKLQTLLGNKVTVAHAMRYQNPNIKTALADLQRKGVNHIVIVPLFPQYSSAASGSALQVVMEELAAQWDVPSISILPPFFDRPEFIQAFVSVIRPFLTESWDHILFSFHGLPERHCRKSDLSQGAHCFQSPHCCNHLTTVNQYCYRAQCMATAHSIAATLRLSSNTWSVSFQSRLGRTPWIKPYTDVVLDELAEKGVKRILLISPSFVADCLETLEEISVRGQEQFRARGGETLQLVPSLNSNDVWVEAVAKMCLPLF